MAKGRRVAIPSVGGSFDRLIKGKKYTVLEEYEYSFTVKSETGNTIFCLKGDNKCSHLQKKGSWELLTERK